MKLLQGLRTALNQKSVVQNIFFCLAIILLMHLLYGVYRSSTVLQEGKKSKKKKGKKGKKKKGKKGKKGKKKKGNIIKKIGSAGKRRANKICNKKKKRNTHGVTHKTLNTGIKQWDCKKCPIGKEVKQDGNIRVCVGTSDNNLNKNNPPPKDPPKDPCNDVDCNKLVVWEKGANMEMGEGEGPARIGHGMVFLPGVGGEKGTVMVAGGEDEAGSVMKVVELYDVQTGEWDSGTALRSGKEREGHGMVFLPGGSVGEGTVMVAGGFDGMGMEGVSVELYDVKARAWNQKKQLGTGRANHGMVFLPGGSVGEGTVMVAGGTTKQETPLKSVEFYIVGGEELDEWQNGPEMNIVRQNHGMVFLPGVGGEKGTVMVAGGDSGGQYLASVELYDVNTGKWREGGGKQMKTARSNHGMVFLPGVGDAGTVMVAGGYNDNNDNPDADVGQYRDEVELYDVKAGEWRYGTPMKAARYEHGMVFLPGVGGEKGSVMVAGGEGESGYLNSVELYDVQAGVQAINCGCV